MKRIKASRTSYRPHHPVQNPNKPTKIRRVANAASLFKGQSLNNNLLTGPDLLAILTGILLRFRKHSIGLLADIEGMFMQVSNREEDRPALRFLWSYNGKVHQYEYTRLIFGATCSPFCAIYALQKCVLDNRDSFPLAYNAILNNFHVDDYIASVLTLGEAPCGSRETRESLKQVGFCLTKFLSNNKLALQHIPCEDHDEIKTLVRTIMFLDKT